MHLRLGVSILFSASAIFGQTQQAPQAAMPVAAQTASPRSYTVQTGTRIPLGLINSVSTKHSAPGDRIYLETVFPIVINNHIVIPPGSYVMGTVTDIKRAGRVHGRAELYVRFDSLTLPNGVTRDFRSRLGQIDARGDEHLDKKEGRIEGDSNKGGDARTVAETTMGGASIGAIAGAAAGHGIMGVGVGSAAGAAAGLAGVLLTRGPDAVLAKGSTIEMILDRPLIFESNELNFANTTASSGHYSDGPGPSSRNDNSGMTRRFPF